MAVSGSDTSANALFGALQVTTARESGLSPELLAAANSSGGVLGRMILPQNLTIVCAAVGLTGPRGRSAAQGADLERGPAAGDVPDRDGPELTGPGLDAALTVLDSDRSGSCLTVPDPAPALPGSCPGPSRFLTRL
ncbi:hypothetical protein GCM10010276_43200 [Streptomyces longisporus]|uniref:L-lactate permease n=1 Tax=Streptomyces longisporus TaxID=1948 RepID=A0ABP5ZH34_STRLO